MHANDHLYRNIFLMYEMNINYDEFITRYELGTYILQWHFL